MTQPENSSGKDDVRMRGFRSRTPVEEALQWVDGNVALLEPEVVGLSDVHGRVLAEDITSPINVPAFDRSAMDGFALKSAEQSFGEQSHCFPQLRQCLLRCCFPSCLEFYAWLPLRQ